MIEKITCPQCHSEIDVNELLYHEIREKHSAKLAEEQNKLQEFANQLNQAKVEFEAKKHKENELFQQRLDARLKEDRKVIEQKLKRSIEHEKLEEINALHTELNEKSQKLQEFNRIRAQIEKLKREKEELKTDIEASAEAKLNGKLQEERKKIKQAEEMKTKEWEKKYNDQVRLTEEMRKKQEQGSIQLQGEVQEIAIEDYLKQYFPLDDIKPVKTGHRGADCLQRVHSRSKEDCGSIYYESKRTKDFNDNWIKKLKSDQKECGAHIAVLVTDAMPKDMQRMGWKDGVLVCTFEEFKGLCFVIREHIVALDNVICSQENKGEKMLMLYNYLSSNTFRLNIEGLIDTYLELNEDLQKESRAITGYWKKREQQHQKLLSNVSSIYSSIRGIAGSVVQPIAELEITTDQLTVSKQLAEAAKSAATELETEDIVHS